MMAYKIARKVYREVVVFIIHLETRNRKYAQFDEQTSSKYHSVSIPKFMKTCLTCTLIYSNSRQHTTAGRIQIHVHVIDKVVQFRTLR